MSRRKRNKNWIFKTIILVLLVVAGVVVYFVWDGYFRDKGGEEKGDEDNSTQIVEADGEEKKDDLKKESEEDIEEYIDKKPIQYDGGSPNEFEYLTGVVNYINADGDKVVIRTSIDQYLEDGTCELVLIQNEETVYQEAVDIINDATTSTCKGFDVPKSGLSVGEVQFIIYLNSGDKVGEISGGVEI